MNTCKCCGSVIPEKTIKRIDQMAGAEHVKRAIEVAHIGDHPIWFYGNSHAAEWCSIVRQFEETFGLNRIQTFYTKPCRCGNWQSIIRECTCTVSAVRRWQTSKSFLKAKENHHIWIDVPELTVWDYEKQKRIDESKHRNEPDETIAERILEARKRRDGISTMFSDDVSESLMRACFTQLPMLVYRKDNIFSVARSIAASAAIYSSATAIQPAHLAEAIQYQIKRDLM